MEKLQGIGVDVSKITTTDTILTLAQKTLCALEVVKRIEFKRTIISL